MAVTVDRKMMELWQSVARHCWSGSVARYLSYKSRASKLQHPSPPPKPLRETCRASRVESACHVPQAEWQGGSATSTLAPSHPGNTLSLSSRERAPCPSVRWQVSSLSVAPACKVSVALKCKLGRATVGARGLIALHALYVSRPETHHPRLAE